MVLLLLVEVMVQCLFYLIYLLLLIQLSMIIYCTKRIQPARGWCATVPPTVQIVSTYPASPKAQPPSFWGSQPCVPVAWLAERLLLAGDIESNPGPLDVSRESGASAGQVEEMPGRASLEKLGCRTPPQLHAGGVG